MMGTHYRIKPEYGQTGYFKDYNNYVIYIGFILSLDNRVEHILLQRKDKHILVNIGEDCDRGINLFQMNYERQVTLSGSEEKYANKLLESRGL